MSETGLQLRWGHGFEDAESRAAVRSKLVDSYQLATESLAELGMEFDSRLYMIPSVGKPDTAGKLGETKERCTQTFHMYLSRAALRGRFDRVAVTTIMAHELTHLYRQQSYACLGFTEQSVSEGVAYSCDDIVARAILRKLGSRPSDYDTTVSRTKEIPLGVRKKFREAFLELAFAPEDVEKPEWDSWNLTPVKPIGISKSEIVGIDTTQARIREGLHISDIVSMKAKSVFGVH